MPPPKFGSQHTTMKLDRLEDYLKAYATALKKQNFTLVYFDAFAGAGAIEIADATALLLKDVDDFSPFVHGSAQRALRLGEAFSRYVFVDSNRRNITELGRLRDQHPLIADRILVRRGDANTELREFCDRTDWRRTRAVVFLDPYGNQVKWSTIEAIASTGGIDLWYLFPAGLGVYRQISQGAGVHKTHEASLDELLGTPEWRTSFIESRPIADLFGLTEQVTRVATPESITRFMLDRMKGIFRGGVLDDWLPLGAKGIHMYSLMFAWANPYPKARLAGKLAQAVLRSAASGRPK